MARALTKKQRKFVNEYAESGNGTKAALKAYDTKDADVAAVIAVENLGKPKIQEELKILGFDENTAKRVVGEILTNEDIEPQHRLKASEQIFKVMGSYAPEKTENLNKNINVNVDTDIVRLADEAAKLLKERKL